VVALIGRGWPYKKIARELTLSVRTVEDVVNVVADLLPNAEDIPPGSLVMLWAFHVRLAEADDGNP
jgi:hypothetical protein